VTRLLAWAALLAAGWPGQAAAGVDLTPAEVRKVLTHSPLPPPPLDETNAVADDPAAARLGQFLFFETRISGSGRFSCASCHDPARSFTDGRPVFEAAGHGARHTLSLWNVAYNRWLFWDGRADSLWAQALKPIEHPLEMAGNRQQVVGLLRGDPGLRAAYEAIFGPLSSSDEAEAVSRAFANAGKAIEAYQRRLISRRAPFDVFAEGLRDRDASKLAALSDGAQRGLRLFMGRGNCRVCHAGPNFTDGEFHDIGLTSVAEGPLDPGRYAGIEALLRDEFGASGPYSDDRNGPRAQASRFLVASFHNLGQMKTPSLRNVATTAPYMHRGQLATLQDVLHHYSTVDPPPLSGAALETLLRPLRLTEQEIADLVAFLESLTDTAIDPELLTKPPTPGRR
jgi:cytochrome c peroxidase